MESTKLKVLTKEEYDKNPAFYQKSFKKIYLSNFLDLEKTYLKDWDDFF